MDLKSKRSGLQLANKAAKTKPFEKEVVKSLISILLNPLRVF